MQENVIQYEEKVLRELQEEATLNKDWRINDQQELINQLKEEYKDVICDCNIPDKHGNYNPCCAQGKCTAYYAEEPFSMCTCCGAEMFREKDEWFHHSQSDIPFENRTPHNSLPKQ